MKKKILKTVFILAMTTIIAFLSYKIFVIEKRKADIVEQIAKIESVERNTSRRAIIEPSEDLPEGSPPPSPPPPQTIIQVSPTDGLRVELNETTSWNTILQLIFTLLATYLGVRLINKHVRD